MADPDLKKSLTAISSVFSEDEIITDFNVLQALAQCQDHLLERVAEIIIQGETASTGRFQVTHATMEAALTTLGIDEDIIQEAKANAAKQKPKKRKAQRKYTEADVEEQERLMTAARDRFTKDKG